MHECNRAMIQGRLFAFRKIWSEIVKVNTCKQILNIDIADFSHNFLNWTNLTQLPGMCFRLFWEKVRYKALSRFREHWPDRVQSYVLTLNKNRRIDMPYKLNVNVCRGSHIQEWPREQNAAEVKDPLFFFLELPSQFPKVLLTMSHSFHFSNTRTLWRNIKCHSSLLTV